MDKYIKYDMYCHQREETLTFGRLSMIEMPVRPTLDIMSSGHNINGAWLLIPLGVGIIGAGVTKLAMCWCGCDVELRAFHWFF